MDGIECFFNCFYFILFILYYRALYVLQKGRDENFFKFEKRIHVFTELIALRIVFSMTDSDTCSNVYSWKSTRLKLSSCGVWVLVPVFVQSSNCTPIRSRVHSVCTCTLTHEKVLEYNYRVGVYEYLYPYSYSSTCTRIRTRVHNFVCVRTRTHEKYPTTSLLAITSAVPSRKDIALVANLFDIQLWQNMNYSC